MRCVLRIVAFTSLVGLLAFGSGLALAGKPPPPSVAVDFAFLKEGKLSVCNLSGSYVVAIANESDDGSPAWSPDGSWIAYTVQVPSGSQYLDVYRVRPDGTGRELLMSYREGGPYPPPRLTTRLAWLDGNRILYHTKTTIEILDVTAHTVTSAPWPFPDEIGPNYFSLAPDMDHDPLNGYQGWLAFGVGEGSTNADWNVAAVGLVVDTGGIAIASQRTVVRYEKWQNFPEWSPDGNYLAFVDEASGGEGRSLAILRFYPKTGLFDDPAQRTVLYTNPGTTLDGNVWPQPTWSPDGRWIAFCLRVSRNGMGDLVRVPTDQGPNQTPTPILTSRRLESEPDWRPAP